MVEIKISFFVYMTLNNIMILEKYQTFITFALVNGLAKNAFVSSLSKSIKSLVFLIGWPETQSEFFSQLVDFINTEYGNAYISNVKFHANNSIKVRRN